MVGTEFRRRMGNLELHTDGHISGQRRFWNEEVKRRIVARVLGVSGCQSRTCQLHSFSMSTTQYPFVVACIAVGSLYRSWALAMIETLRTNGDYKGRVYILTDKPRDFAFMEEVAVVPVAPGQSVIAIKAYKTWLRDLIDAEEILYLDVDVLIGSPLHIWHKQVREKLGSRPIATFRDTGKHTARYHTGVIYMTSATDPVLLQWRDALENGQYSSDQIAFQDTIQSDAIVLMPEEHLLFPEKECMRNKRVRTFVHITFYRQRIFSLLAIRNYMTTALGCSHMPENFRLSGLFT
jgi:hypothetical protein